ncbi:putative Ketoreductase (KR) domain-containing protein [Seiridium unicorne]|uniref:Ketoreductase (KR) domain-containing protein n=1 Tax=Seiridium unicorne TaxID=138068 RepID=A0ABR2VDJ7_9PEZI
MVKSSDIIQSNQLFSHQHQNDKGVVGVFAGATSGIGARTLERMITMFHSPTFYVLGRSSTGFAAQRKILESLNPDCNIIYIETNVALISGIDLACQQIQNAENKVDYLYMSMGRLPLAGAQYTTEGLETCLTISYTSRMRLLFNLLPLLDRSAHPRVLSVLNGGKEKRIAEEDVGLEKSWSIIGAVNQSTLFTSLTFEGLAADRPNLTLIHNAPGMVESDNVRRNSQAEDTPFSRRIIMRIIKLVMRVVRYFLGMSPKEAGERQTYHLTSENYGTGSFRVDKDSEIVLDNDVLISYRESGWISKIWEFTLATWAKALERGNNVS